MPNFTTRKWLLANRRKCASLTASDIARLLGVTRQNVHAVLATEPDIAVRFGVSTVLRAEKTAALKAAYEAALDQKQPTTMTELANAVGMSRSMLQWQMVRYFGAAWRTRVQSTVRRNHLQRHGVSKKQQIREFLRAQRGKVTSTEVAEALSLDIMLVRAFIYQITQREPVLLKKWKRIYRSRQ